MFVTFYPHFLNKSMIKVNFSFKVSIAEQFFIERSLELLHNNTIDTYRLRLNNSMTILDELISVSEKLILNQIKNNIYISDVLEEACELLHKDKNIVWGTYDKNYLVELKKKPEINLRKIYLFANGLRKLNKNYTITLIEKIENEIKRLNNTEVKDIIELKEINSMTPSFWICIVRMGYSKNYLFKILMSWISNSKIVYEDFFSRIKSLENRPEENFTIIFAIKGISNDFKIYNKEISILESDQIEEFSRESHECAKFFKVKDGQFISVTAEAHDYYSAVMKVKSLLNGELDLIHYSKSNFYPKIYDYVLVIGKNNPTKAKVQNYYYQIEGYYQHSIEVYESLSQKLNNLETKNIHTAAVEKVRAGLMYYRLGSESNELHSKLLNYWIGMEFIFSAYESNENTIPRLKRYYSKMQGLLLFKRILLNFHSNIGNLDISENFIDYKTDDIEYLLNQKNYENAIALIEKYPLLSYRAQMIKELFDESKTISKMVHKSADNIEKNLTRIYRIRNEIVHNASSVIGMETVVSHLKFYLLFTVYSVVHFFDEKADDFNFDGRIDIDDFFEIRELKFDNFFPKDNSKIDIQKLKLIKMPMEDLFYPKSIK